MSIEKLLYPVSTHQDPKEGQGCFLPIVRIGIGALTGLAAAYVFKDNPSLSDLMKFSIGSAGLLYVLPPYIGELITDAMAYLYSPRLLGDPSKEYKESLKD